MHYKYQRSFAAGEKKTSTANEVIDFLQVDPIDGDILNFSVSFLRFETFGSPCRIRLNNEPTIHWIDALSEVTFADIEIDKFTILDAGVEYYYTAFVQNN